MAVVPSTACRIGLLRRVRALRRRPWSPGPPIRPRWSRPSSSRDARLGRGRGVRRRRLRHGGRHGDHRLAGDRYGRIGACRLPHRHRRAERPAGQCHRRRWPERRRRHRPGASRNGDGKPADGARGCTRRCRRRRRRRPRALRSARFLSAGAPRSARSPSARAPRSDRRQPPAGPTSPPRQPVRCPRHRSVPESRRRVRWDRHQALVRRCCPIPQDPAVTGRAARPRRLLRRLVR